MILLAIPLAAAVEPCEEVLRRLHGGETEAHLVEQVVAWPTPFPPGTAVCLGNGGAGSALTQEVRKRELVQIDPGRPQRELHQLVAEVIRSRLALHGGQGPYVFWWEPGVVPAYNVDLDGVSLLLQSSGTDIFVDPDDSASPSEAELRDRGFRTRVDMQVENDALGLLLRVDPIGAAGNSREIRIRFVAEVAPPPTVPTATPVPARLPPAPATVTAPALARRAKPYSPNVWAGLASGAALAGGLIWTAVTLRQYDVWAETPPDQKDEAWSALQRSNAASIALGVAGGLGLGVTLTLPVLKR